MYLKITLRNLPQIRFAHSHTTNHYDSFLAARRDYLELVCYQQGDTVWTYPDGTQTVVTVPWFMLRLGDFGFRAYSEAGQCRHITAGIDVSYCCQQLTREELLADSQSRQEGNLVFYIPEEGLAAREDSPAEALLQQLINHFALPDREQSLRCMSILFELLGVLTAETIRSAMLQDGKVSPAGLHYAKRAARYIREHLSERLTVEKVATNFNISTGYLSSLFKTYTGTSVIKYINAARIERVREMLLFGQMNLREAGESVGIYDENYCSRLFKQYTGLTVREFLRRNQISE